MRDMENLIGQMVHVVVSKDGKSGTKILKVCKVKARSVLFIEVDRENRKNIFRKVANKDITSTGMIGDSPFVYVKEGVIPEKWESSWDSMGQPSQMSINARITPIYNNHSKGWSQKAAWYRANSQYGAHFRT
jgi:hypothetical protein